MKVRRRGKIVSKIFLEKVNYIGPFIFIEFKKSENDGPKNTLTAQLKEFKFKNVIIEIKKKPRSNNYDLNFLSPANKTN